MYLNITVAGVATQAVTLPQPTRKNPAGTASLFSMVEWDYLDRVALNESPFTGQQQTYGWPGADMLSGTITLPKLTQRQLNQWRAALLACRGPQFPFLLGDPLQYAVANPAMLTGSAPEIDNSVAGSNAVAAVQLNTKGWKANTPNLLLDGDLVQVGERMHVNLFTAASDGNGKATLTVWPSLREVPTDGAPLGVRGVQGLFRRADNDFKISASVQDGSQETGGLWSLSFRIREYR